MTIDEAKKAKQLAEFKIEQIIKNLQADTQLVVERIVLTQESTATFMPLTIDVKLDIRF